MFLLVSLLLCLVILGWAVFSDFRKCREVRRAMNAARGFEPPVYPGLPPAPHLRDVSEIEAAIVRLRAASAAVEKKPAGDAEAAIAGSVSAAEALETPATAPGAEPSEISVPSVEPVAAGDSAEARVPASAVEPPLQEEAVPISEPIGRADAEEAVEALRNAPAMLKPEPATVAETSGAAAQPEIPAPVVEAAPAAESTPRVELAKQADLPKPEGRVLDVRVQPEGANTMPPENVARLVVEHLFQAGFSTQLQESVAGADIWVKRPGDPKHTIKITVGTGEETQPNYGIGVPLGEGPNPENPKPGTIVVQLPGLPRRG